MTMKTLTANLLALAVICAVLGSGSAARAATAHPILKSMASYVVYDNSVSHCTGATSSVLTEVKLRRGHIAASLSVALYVGRKWKGSRHHEVGVTGKTSVEFFTCVPYRLLFNARTGANYNTRIVVTTMPRSRDTMGTKIVDND
jgi:hypothetical protein